MKQAIDTLPARKVWSKPFKSTILWGIVSLVLYFLVFSNQAAVTEYFTRGGAMAAAIVVTALIFSVVHGTFANYVLEVFGITALKHDKEGH